MALLTKITNDLASAEIKEIFSALTAAVGEVPQPLRMLAGSPGLFMHQIGLVEYYRNHPHLDFSLLLCIRYLSAKKLKYQACIEFNGSLLRRQGMTELEMESMVDNPDNAPLSKRERALLSLVLQAVESGGSAENADIARLKDYGWTESDIIDAVSQGVGMMTHGRLLEFFKMGEVANCIQTLQH